MVPWFPLHLFIQAQLTHDTVTRSHSELARVPLRPLVLMNESEAGAGAGACWHLTIPNKY